MAPLLALLAQQGLSLLGNAVLAKGKAVIEEKLGVDIEDAVKTPEGLIRLKELELQHEAELHDFVLAQREQELKADKMAYADTDSARDMNARVNESANASWLSKNIAAVLALVVVIGGGIALTSTPDPDVRTASVGLMTLVLGFYFGSSRGSATKDTTIEQMSRRKP